MKHVRNVSLCCLMMILLFGLLGCGKKADENRPIPEAKAEAEKMNAAELREMALTYKEAVTGKKAEVDKLMGQLKDIPIAEKLGADAKKLQAELKSLNDSIAALQQRFQIYYNKLKEKGGDLSGLEI